jgi:hypothetical protein
MFVFLCFSIMDQIWGNGKGKISRLLTGWYKFFFGGNLELQSTGKRFGCSLG